MAKSKKKTTKITAKKKTGKKALRGRSARSFQESSPFVKLLKETHQHPSLRQAAIKAIGEHFNAFVITYFCSFNNPDALITDDDAEMIEGILSAEYDSGRLLLIINAPGGMALAAERIANVCREYSKSKFEVLVPHMAKSAATMIAFGASVIHMSPTAELGPVDPQVPYTTPDGRQIWISAAEYIRSYDGLMETGTRGDVKRLEPIVQQLSRYDDRYIEQLKSAQQLSEDISVKLLSSGMMKAFSEDDIRSKIRPFLVQEETASHGRMLAAKRTKMCGLNVELIDLKGELWDTIWELYVRSDWIVKRQSGKIIESAQSALSA